MEISPIGPRTNTITLLHRRRACGTGWNLTEIIRRSTPAMEISPIGPRTNTITLLHRRWACGPGWNPLPMGHTRRQPGAPPTARLIPSWLSSTPGSPGWARGCSCTSSKAMTLSRIMIRQSTGTDGTLTRLIRATGGIPISAQPTAGTGLVSPPSWLPGTTAASLPRGLQRTVVCSRFESSGSAARATRQTWGTPSSGRQGGGSMALRITRIQQRSSAFLSWEREPALGTSSPP